MIKDIKELEKLLKICRKQGVTELAFGDVNFKLGEMPKGNSAQAEPEVVDDSDIDAMTGMPTDEELAFYSVQVPGEVEQ